MTELINCEPPRLKVMYIPTDDNPSDLGSKNGKDKLHTKHTNNIYNGTLLPEALKGVNDESIEEDVAPTNAFIPVSTSKRARKSKHAWKSKTGRVKFSI